MIERVFAWCDIEMVREEKSILVCLHMCIKVECEIGNGL